MTSFKWIVTVLLFSYVRKFYSEAPPPTPQLCVVWYELSDGRSCLGGEAGLLTTGFWISYSANTTDISRGDFGTFNSKLWVDYNSSRRLDLQYYANLSQTRIILGVDYSILQPEHGGGLCHCFEIYFDGDCVSIQDSKNISYRLCGGIASVERMAAFTWRSPGIVENKTLEVDRKKSIISTECDNSPNYFSTCDPVDQVQEGVEFSIRLSSGEWIPIVYAYFGNNLGQLDDTITIREYSVPRVRRVSDSTPKQFEVQVCNVSSDSTIQLRWIQTSMVTLPHRIPRDIWNLDNVNIASISDSFRINILTETFDDRNLDNDIWSNRNIRNGNISTKCSFNGDSALVFGQNAHDYSSSTPTYNIYTSRGVLTKPINLSSFKNVSSSSESRGAQTTTTSLTPVTAHSREQIVNIVTTDHESRGAQTTAATSPTPVTAHSTEQIVNIVTTYHESRGAQTTAATSLTPVTAHSTEQIVNIVTTDHESRGAQTTAATSPTPVTAHSTEQIVNIVTTYHESRGAQTTAATSPTPVTAHSTEQIVNIVTTDQREQIVMLLTDTVQQQISQNKAISTLLNISNTATRLSLLRSVASKRNITSLLLAYILQSSLSQLSHAELMNTTGIIQEALMTGCSIMDQSMTSSFASADDAIATGTTILQSFDSIAVLSSTPYKFSCDGIVSETYSINTTSSYYNAKTNSSTSLILPLELLEMYSTNGSISVVRNIMRNGFIFFPQLNGLELVSDILGLSLTCGSQECPTTSLNLKNPVVLTFKHSLQLTEMLRSNSSKSTKCVFLDIPQTDQVLSIGYWSNSGCQKDNKNSSFTETTCLCSHLTHFAILLSSSPPEFSPTVNLSLKIIGYVGVSISVIAMAATILILVLVKFRHKLRNYIHINLCVNLSISQLIFIALSDQTGSADGPVPAQCQAIAVLLHYFFLVSFMWMLMEGVFLYLALVKVFLTNLKAYFISFTVISYGVPFLYVGLLSLPLGFGLPDGPHYGSPKICFLRADTHFVWAFIAPVILILIANIGFIGMGANIMWKQQRKLNKSKKCQAVMAWTRSVLALIVVMGVPWIFGLIVIEEDFVALAYIHVILVSFQGLAIFTVIVLLSKEIQEPIKKCFATKSSQSKNSYFSILTLKNTLLTKHIKSHEESQMESLNDDQRQGENTGSSVFLESDTVPSHGYHKASVII